MRFSLALSIWKPARLEMCSLACLTFVDFITRGVMNAPVLCCSCVSTKKGFRQVLQTVAQCTETAGATHQGSVEMTSPDKCTSDSSPAPIPPPQAPRHVLSLVQATRPDRTGGRPRAAAWKSGCAVTLHQVGRR